MSHLTTYLHVADSPFLRSKSCLVVLTVRPKTARLCYSRRRKAARIAKDAPVLSVFFEDHEHSPGASSGRASRESAGQSSRGATCSVQALL